MLHRSSLKNKHSCQPQRHIPFLLWSTAPHLEQSIDANGLIGVILLAHTLLLRAAAAVVGAGWRVEEVLNLALFARVLLGGRVLLLRSAAVPTCDARKRSRMLIL